MKILCPTDLSPEATYATAYAAKLAQATGSSLTLLNVQMLAELTPAEALFGQEANVRNAEMVFESHCDEIGKVFHITCNSIVRASVNSLTSIIDETAQGFGLLVMGSDGPDSFMERLRGSKTFQVLLKTETATVVVPNKAGYANISRIVFAYDYRRNKDVPMRQLIDFAKLTGASIVMLQVVEERWTRQIELEIESAVKRISADMNSVVPIGFKTIYADDHSSSLSEYMQQSGGDILAVAISEKAKMLFGRSKTREIVENASYPLLIVHR